MKSGSLEDEVSGHSTQKPVEAYRRPILNHTLPGASLYEPFSGSGTAIIACEELGRGCFAVEVAPEYVQLAIERWQRYTGKTAELAERAGAVREKPPAPGQESR